MLFILNISSYFVVTRPCDKYEWQNVVYLIAGWPSKQSSNPPLTMVVMSAIIDTVYPEQVHFIISVTVNFMLS